MNIQEISQHKNICIMGLGEMFSDCIQELEKNLTISYICDNNPSNAKSNNSVKYSFISPADLPSIPDVFVIVTTSFENYIALDSQLASLGVPNCYVLSIQDFPISRPVIQLSKLDGPYKDKWGNTIETPKGVYFPRHAFVMFGDDTNKPVHYGRSHNNHFQIGENARLSGPFLLEFYGSDCRVDLGKEMYFGNMHVIIAQGACMSVGNGSTFEGLYAVIYEGGQVNIGQNCMFSHNIQLWQTDTHPIFSRKTGERLNKSRNITVGNHVWIGVNTILLGGADLGSGCVVGANSITSGTFPPNVIVAGNPARTINKDIVWANDQLYLSDINSIDDCSDKVAKALMIDLDE
jgi:acetyltransferase-like isoleucine patch superfamily enzyme